MFMALDFPLMFTTFTLKLSVLNKIDYGMHVNTFQILKTKTVYEAVCINSHCYS